MNWNRPKTICLLDERDEPEYNFSICGVEEGMVLRTMSAGTHHLNSDEAMRLCRWAIAYYVWRNGIND